MSSRECLRYPLHQAAALGLTQECVQLLGLGLEPRQEDEAGLTPLQHANKNDHAAVALTLCAWLAREEAQQAIAEIMGAKP